jgi:hypothetical protein
MADLEDRLRDAGAGLEFPPTPNFATRVAVRLGERPRRRWFTQRRLAAAIAVVVAAALVVTIPPVRDTVAGWLGLRGIGIHRVQQVPKPAPATMTPGRLGGRLLLGRRETLAEAQRAVPFTIRLPAALPEPDEVYLEQNAPQPDASFVYQARPDLAVSREAGVGALVTETQAQLEPQYLEKLLGPKTTISQVTADGVDAYWIEGEPHAIFYRDARGRDREETLRLAGNTLVWFKAGVTYRLEANVSRERAIELANSFP